MTAANIAKLRTLYDRARFVGHSVASVDASDLFDLLRSAERVGELEARVKALEEENAKLRRPTLFWVDADPETGYLDLSEAIEAALGWPACEGGVASIRTGREIAVEHYAVLPAADDSDSDDDWECGFSTYKEADAALKAEKARRALLAATGEVG